MYKLKMKLGFSLLEMLIVLSIISIILVFSLFPQKIFLDKANDQVASSQLLRAINLTRSESITRGIPVTLCKSTDKQTCGGEWKEGYIVIADQKVLFTFQMREKGELRWRSFPWYRNDLQFLPTGLLNSENGTFWYCASKNKNPSWAIMISLTGRARLALPNKEGNICDDKGEFITC